MLDILQCDVNFLVSNIVVPKPILMCLQFAQHFSPTKWGPNPDILKSQLLAPSLDQRFLVDNLALINQFKLDNILLFL